MATETQLMEVVRSLADIKKSMEDFRQEVRQDLAALKGEIRKEIQEEIRALRQEMDTQQRKVSGEMEDQRAEIVEVQGRVAETEEWRIETDVALESLEERTKKLQDRLLDLQSRQMRNNLRVFNCPESAEEGTNMVDFIGQLFWAELDLPEGTELQIMRAHRALTRKPQDSTVPPRSIVINFQRFDTKEMVLRKAWEKEIKVAGRRLGFDHDYPPEVVKMRKEYAPLKRILKQAKISFQSPYTKLRVHWEDGTKIYGSVAEAARDIRARGYKEKTPTRTRASDSAAGDVRTATWTRDSDPTAGDAEATPETGEEMSGEAAMDEKDRRRREDVERWQRVLRRKTGDNGGTGKIKNKRTDQMKM